MSFSSFCIKRRAILARIFELFKMSPSACVEGDLETIELGNFPAMTSVTMEMLFMMSLEVLICLKKNEKRTTWT